jgi:hypothetical protein
MTLAFNWQSLGAWVNDWENVKGWQLDKFAAVGGKWITVSLIELSGGAGTDNPEMQWNRANIESIKSACAQRGIVVSGWYVGWGGDAATNAAEVAAFHKTHALGPIILDLEGPYQLNLKVADLTLAIRQQFPVGTKPVGVTTNSLNDSQVYNGRVGSVTAPSDKSFYDLKIRVIPQWYNSPAYGGCWTDPVCNMKTLYGPGGTGASDNLSDPDAPGGRAVQPGWVKPVLEVTALESSTLAPELSSCVAAQVYGLGKGVSIYLLENVPDGDPHGDFQSLAAYRGHLFL